MIDVINEVMTATFQRNNKTAISNTDSSAFFLDKINDALQNIYNWCPTAIDVDATLTLPASTRTVSIATGVDINRVYKNLWRINDSAGDIPLELVSEEFIITQKPLYETEEALKPQYVYYSNGNAAFYPLLKTGQSSLTIQYKYPTQFTKLEATTDTFPFPDRSEEKTYIKLFAQYHYEKLKGLGDPDSTYMDMVDVKHILKARYAKLKRVGITSHRRYGDG